MSDLLVKLSNLPNLSQLIMRQRENRIDIRRPITPEKQIIVDWINKNFNIRFADECEISFSNRPISCFIAIKEGMIIGFACYDTTYKNFLGPIGVLKEHRGLGIGKTLFTACLHAMAEEGYLYAVVGGSSGYTKKIIGGIIIKKSDPGIYRGILWGD